MTREEAIKELQSYADASWGGLSNVDDFCSYGERRGNGG